MSSYHILTPHVYISICVLSWGLIASLQAITTNFSQMLVLRTLLGISEAAFSPGVPFYLSFFFRREELALRAGMQVSAAPLAASFAGSLAWAITKLGQKSPLAPWRLLFLVEGFPSVIVAVIAWNFVPDSPETAKFLTSRQQRIAQHRLRKENRSSSQELPQGDKMARLKSLASKKTIDWGDILSTLKDPKCYLTAVCKRGAPLDAHETDIPSSCSPAATSPSAPCRSSFPQSSTRWAIRPSTAKHYPHRPSSSLSSFFCSQQLPLIVLQLAVPSSPSMLC